VLFEAGNASALAKVLGDVDSCPERYAEYGRAARRTYELRFDPDQNIDQLLGIYRFAIQHPVATPAARRWLPRLPSRQSDRSKGDGGGDGPRGANPRPTHQRPREPRAEARA
jgi:hypothetical protein